MSQNNQDTGFGDKASQMGGRMVNRDGTFNIQRLGIPFFARVSSYHSMLTMPRWRFILVVFNAEFVMNPVHRVWKGWIVNIVFRG